MKNKYNVLKRAVSFSSVIAGYDPQSPDSSRNVLTFYSCAPSLRHLTKISREACTKVGDCGVLNTSECYHPQGQECEEQRNDEQNLK